ncbi:MULTISPECIES: FHA domain-containing protein [unclassified Crossiella]|uniref:FHA domain-containing protein n=1 Tax=unclassified Crossiella TaxID=2620835 RepID=UPI001FFED60D|nr:MULTISPECIES: FHA domain-containing protein [unclassified Crossiella]MCK2241285.1 FHA domain-containing protein [Crossiella sp. S99.2]MCK2253571.1 FHA domain-containing protein [Crossiella sp. S99.1]
MGERPGVLPPAHHSLAWGMAGGAPGTLNVLAVAGGITVGPREGREVLFGRNRPDVHVCVGENDRRISRRHGCVTYRDDQWWLSTLGRLPVRLPGARLLFNQDEPIPLGPGYTPVFVRGSNHREHLLEVHVQGAAEDGRGPEHEASTRPPNIWALSPVEQLVLVVLGQRYLLHEAYPTPLSWRQAAEHLTEIRPAEEWTSKRVEHLVMSVRNRLSRGGVPGLTREEINHPVGNTVNHNLIRELLESTTLVPPDLRLLGYED